MQCLFLFPQKVDDRTPQYVRDILERHPAAPFLSLHHEDKVFKPTTEVWAFPARTGTLSLRKECHDFFQEFMTGFSVTCA